MAESLLCDFWVHAGKQKLRRVRMPQIVETHPRHPFHAVDETSELVGEAPRLHRQAVGPSADEGILVLSDADLQEFLSLVTLEPAKLVQREGRERHRARLALFGG